jgi:hypothetical protein
MRRLIIGAIWYVALAAASAGLMRSGLYGLTLFIVLPAFVGAVSAWACRARTAVTAAGLGALGSALALGSLLIFGEEGLVCIVMTLPLAIPLGAVGGLLVYVPSTSERRSAAALLLIPPTAFMHDTHARPPLFEVKTAIEIAQPPEKVWRHVVTFADLPEPREWFFRAGLAYPMRARIEGSGVRAVRYCEFSTGPFVEPIEVWDEPRLLQFRVTDNPAPMHEWSPYAKVTPKHLHGYFISQKGQFRLMPLEGGRTLLEGTTWYQHGLWPTEYWRWWSDAIIHRIHLRVLTHIRSLAESADR